MSEIDIRVVGAAGRITLNRPAALNALTYPMITAIEAALDAWRGDPTVALVVIDAAGDKAFCSGGDIAEMYRTGTAGDFAYGRRFWADEYRLNAKIAAYPKPYVALMQGFTMGGGVGVSCHGSHRVVCETSRIAMPECGIGLIPDVGGSLLLARAPGRLGSFLGATGHRMGPADAIYAGFADAFVPRDAWPAVLAALEDTGDVSAIARAARDPKESDLRRRLDEVASAFPPGMPDLSAATDEVATALARQSPLSVACGLAAIEAARGPGGIAAALATEFRYTYRCMEHGDFLEGIRAAIVDKDRSPRWRYPTLADVSETDVAAMLAPLGDAELNLEDVT